MLLLARSGLVGILIVRCFLPLPLVQAVAPVLGRTAGALACGFSDFFGCKCSLLQEPSNAAGDKVGAWVS